MSVPWFIMSSEQCVGAGNGALQRCTTTFEVTVHRSRKTKQVLFLEAGLDFMNGLFRILVLPRGAFIHMDKKKYLVLPRPVAPGCSSASGTGLQCFGVLGPPRLLQWPYCSTFSLQCQCANCGLWSFHREALCEECGSSEHGDCILNADPDGSYIVQKRGRDEEANRSKTGFANEDTAFIVTDKLEFIYSTPTSYMLELMKMGASKDDVAWNDITVNNTQVVQLYFSALTLNNTCLNDVFGLKK